MKDRDEFRPILQRERPEEVLGHRSMPTCRGKGKAMFAYPFGKDLPSDCSGA